LYAIYRNVEAEGTFGRQVGANLVTQDIEFEDVNLFMVGGEIKF
jgi:hypothetical protein